MARSPRSRDDQRPPRRRRMFWTFGLALLAVGLLGWFAPVIVATTDLRQQVLPYLITEAKADFSIGGASLSWLAPVELRNVTAHDAEGQPLLTVDHISSEKPLWKLVRDQQHLGRVSLAGLTWHATVEADGNNLERAFAGSFATGADSAAPNLVVEVRDSRIELDDRVGDRKATIEIAEAQITVAPGEQTPITASAQGRILDASSTGDIRVEYALQNDEGDASPSVNVIRVQANAASLRPLACVLRRIIGPCDIAGLASGELNLRWDNASEQGVTIAGPLRVDGLQFVHPACLGQDVFASSTAAYSGSLLIEPAQLVAQNAHVELDHGRLNLSGVVPRSMFGGATLREALATLSNENLLAQGEIDVAKIAAALPQTLRIREDTTITGGQLTFNFASDSPNGRRSWNLQLTSTNLTAESNGQPVVWNQPIVIQAAAHQGETGPEIDQLTCHCDFMQIGGQGSLNDATFTARANLTALAQRLGDFIDLKDVTLSGTAEMKLQLMRQSQTPIVALRGSGRLNELKIVVPGSLTWTEQELQLGIKGELNAPADLATFGVQSGELTLASGSDQLTANTVRPAADLGSHDALPIHIEARGGVASWAARLSWLLPLQAWKLEGEVQLSADAEVSHDQIRLVRSQCDILNLIADGPNGYLSEQQLQLTAVGRWAPEEGRLDGSVLTLATTSWSLRGDDVTLHRPTAGAATLNGRFAFHSDLRNTLNSLRAVGDRRQRGVRGIAKGNVTLAAVGDIITLDVDSQLDNLVVEGASPTEPASRYGVRPASAAQVSPLWTERQLKLRGRLSFDMAQDSLQLTSITAESTGATLTVNGQLSALSTKPHANIKGEATYHLAALMRRMNPALGQYIQMQGADTATFSVSGPIFLDLAPTQLASDGNPGAGVSDARMSAISSDLQAAGRFGWEAATLYGLPIGPGEIDAQLRSGVLNVAPLSLAASEGRLNLAPRLYLLEQPAVMTLERGALLENVQLTPAMCRTWLQFVAPLLADATDCTGAVSANIDRATIPLGDAQASSVSGKLTIHGADVRPGPLANSYIQLARRIQGALQGKPPEADSLGAPVRIVHLDEQSLDINMIDGRVYHQGLTMLVGDVAIVTSGSVGVDQSLDLVAEIPVQDAWIDGKSYLVGLQGQTLKVPIRGSVGRPRIDFSIIEELGRQTLTGTTNRVIRGEINKLVGQLLLPPEERTSDNQSIDRLIQGNPLFRNLIPPEMKPPENPQPPPLTPPQVDSAGGYRRSN